jgi:hypothetical protein
MGRKLSWRRFWGGEKGRGKKRSKKNEQENLIQ